jgi:hypothetical protein
MSRTDRATRPFLAIAATVLAVLPGCTHRAIDQVDGALPIPAGVTSIRVELENGTLDVAPPEGAEQAAQLAYMGGVRMDASDDQQLQQLVASRHQLVAAVDAEDPTVLVVRGPQLPAGVQGMIAYEGHIRVPVAMPLEVVVANNGHVTLVGRRAPSKVRTRRGDLRFDDCRAAIKATTGQGNVIAYDHRGDLDVRSQGGDMQAFVVEPGEVLTLSTGKGTVQCHVPESIDCRVDGRAEIGRIGNDFEFDVTKPSPYSAAMTGIRGGGRTKVVLRTAAGHIAMRRLQPRKSD